MPVSIVRFLILGLFSSLVCSGCTKHENRFHIHDVQGVDQNQRFEEIFPEAYYDVDDQGQFDIVLRRIESANDNPNEKIVQTLHLRSVWRSIPGRTTAESSQINGTVTYAIVKGRIGATFEGAGSLFFDHDINDGELNGSLESAMLEPTRLLSTGSDFFKRPKLTGNFEATKNRRKTTRIINDMNRLFKTRGTSYVSYPPSPGS